jgi:hypothetical protein
MTDIPKLVVAILEDKVKAIIGEEAVKQLKQPLLENDLQNNLAEAVQRAEQHWLTYYPDQSVVELVQNMTLADLPSVKAAIRNFYDSPDAPMMTQTLREELTVIAPKSIGVERVEKAVVSYIETLQKELVSIDVLRDKLNALSNLRTERHTAHSAEELRKIRELLTEYLRALASNQSVIPQEITNAQMSSWALITDTLDSLHELDNAIRQVVGPVSRFQSRWSHEERAEAIKQMGELADREVILPKVRRKVSELEGIYVKLDQTSEEGRAAHAVLVCAWKTLELLADSNDTPWPGARALFSLQEAVRNADNAESAKLVRNRARKVKEVVNRKLLRDADNAVGRMRSLNHLSLG